MLTILLPHYRLPVDESIPIRSRHLPATGNRSNEPAPLSYCQVTDAAVSRCQRRDRHVRRAGGYVPVDLRAEGAVSLEGTLAVAQYRLFKGLPGVTIPGIMPNAPLLSVSSCCQNRQGTSVKQVSCVPLIQTGNKTSQESSCTLHNCTEE